MRSWDEERTRMLRRQLQARGVCAPAVIEAMAAVPRHRFVPPELRVEAYGDWPLQIGYGQTISQPYIVGFMSEALELTGAERVLELGTGCGYQTAILSLLAARVYTVERIAELQTEALRVLGELEEGARVERIEARVGDGYEGWPEEAPFDGILVAAAPPRVPPALLEQLADGGRLVIPAGPRGQQRLLRIRRRGEELLREELMRVSFVPLVPGVVEHAQAER